MLSICRRVGAVYGVQRHWPRLPSTLPAVVLVSLPPTPPLPIRTDACRLTAVALAIRIRYPWGHTTEGRTLPTSQHPPEYVLPSDLPVGIGGELNDEGVVRVVEKLACV